MKMHYEIVTTYGPPVDLDCTPMKCFLFADSGNGDQLPDGGLTQQDHYLVLVMDRPAPVVEVPTISVPESPVFLALVAGLMLLALRRWLL